jgi:WD40 repeat protein/tRNA A-37 threonylcarbamoyl transferase component Bud32
MGPSGSLPGGRDALNLYPDLDVTGRASAADATILGGSAMAPSDGLAFRDGISMATSDPQPRRFPARYDIVEKIAETRLSRTWKAFDHVRGTQIVLKEPLPAASLDRTALDRFKQEVQSVSRLTHGSIVPVYDPYLDEPPYFYAMPFIEGVHLDEFCQRQSLSIVDRLRLFLKICEAVQHAHSHDVIHRDLKPNNILVDEDGKPHLLDFGLGRILASADRVELNGVFGAPGYMSPEQAAARATDMRTDVYGLGVILFEMLTGALPIELTRDFSELRRRIVEEPPRRPRALRPELGWELEAIVLRALEKEPGGRYQSVADFARDVDNVLCRRPVSAVPGTRAYRTRCWWRRNKKAIVLVGLVVTSVLALTTYAVTLSLSKAAERARSAEQVATAAEEGRHKLAVAYGRAQTKADNPIAAATTLLAEHRRYDSVRTRGALWEFYRRYPCVYHVGRAFGRQTHVAYSPDGRCLVSVQRENSQDGRLIVYGAETGEEVQILPSEQAKAACIAFAPQGDRLYVGGSDGRIHVWTVLLATGQLAEHSIAENAHLPAAVSAITVSKGGQEIAAGTKQGQICVWAVQTGQFVSALSLTDMGLVADLAFSPDGSRLAIACRSGDISDGYHRGGLWVWDIQSAREIGHRLDRNCRSVRWSEDGQDVLFGDDVVWRWNLASNAEAALGSRVQWGVRSLDLTGDGQYVAVARGDGRIRFYDVRAGEWCQVSGYHESAVADRIGLCFSPDGHHVASVGLDGLRVWDFYPAAIDRLPGLPVLQASASGRTVSPDGTMVAGGFELEPTAASADGFAPDTDAAPANETTPTVYRLYVYVCEHDRWRVFAGSPSAIPVSPIAAFQSPGSVYWGRLGPDAEVSEIGVANLGAPVLDQLCFRVSGYLTWGGWWNEEQGSLLIGCKDGRLWTASTHSCGAQEPRLIPVPWRDAPPSPLTFTTRTTDGRFLAACWEGKDGPGRVVVWRTTGNARPDAEFEQAHELYADFPTHDVTWRMAFVRNRAGDLILATAGSVRDVHLWELPTGRLVGRLVGHRDAVRQCVALEDRLLVTASDDKTARVWDAIEQEEVCELYSGSQGRPLIGVDAGRVAILDGDTLTIADASEFERFVESSAEADSRTRTTANDRVTLRRPGGRLSSEVRR